VTSWAAALSTIAAVGLTVLVLLARGIRASTDADASSTQRGRPRRECWMSTLAWPGLMGYWALPGGMCWERAHVVHHTYENCQLILVTKAHDDVVLDFLVPRSTGADRRSGVCVPMTFRAHQLPRYQSAEDALSTLAASVGSSSFVDIEVDGDARADQIGRAPCRERV